MRLCLTERFVIEADAACGGAGGGGLHHCDESEVLAWDKGGGAGGEVGGETGGGSSLVDCERVAGGRRDVVVSGIGGYETCREPLGSGSEDGTCGGSVREPAGNSSSVIGGARVQLGCGERRAVGDGRRGGPCEGGCGFSNNQRASGGALIVRIVDRGCDGVAVGRRGWSRRAVVSEADREAAGGGGGRGGNARFPSPNPQRSG